MTGESDRIWAWRNFLNDYIIQDLADHDKNYFILWWIKMVQRLYRCKYNKVWDNDIYINVD